MPRKTILVHLNNEHRASVMLDVAASIAGKTGARLLGVFAMPRLAVYGESAAEVQRVAKDRRRLEASNDRVRKAFEQKVAGMAIAGEWQTLNPGFGNATGALISLSRTADLVIESQRDPEHDWSSDLDGPQNLVMETGRPILFVPFAGNFKDVGSRVVIAWNDTREAARAAFDAIPLMTGASNVDVVWFSPHRTATADSKQSTEALTATLVHHGIKASARQSFATDIDVASEMLNHAAESGANLLVMGCYGHSRLRELLLGGASREILQSMTLPVLMSH